MLTRLEVRNFKSIAQCSVDFGSLTVLVGPNGAGKSNFVDAISFISDCLTYSPNVAFRIRGGVASVRRKSRGHPYHIGFRVSMELANLGRATYAFDIAARSGKSIEVSQEKCVIQHFLGETHEFEIQNGKIVSAPQSTPPRLERDRLALSHLAGITSFRPVFDLLTSVGRYSINPQRLREPQDPTDPALPLDSTGSNATSVLSQMERVPSQRPHLEKLRAMLAHVVGGTEGVSVRPVGSKESLVFKQDVGSGNVWAFDAHNMSDGTLRIVGILLAIYQPNVPAVLVIEEPESTIHPAAIAVLGDALIDGASLAQVIVTTHSPDVLDHEGIADAQLVAVRAVQGRTIISPVSDVTRDVARASLYGLGDLLRRDEILPCENEPQSLARSRHLFDFEEPVE